jgi:hypothetical protein
MAAWPARTNIDERFQDSQTKEYSTPHQWSAASTIIKISIGIACFPPVEGCTDMELGCIYLSLDVEHGAVLCVGGKATRVGWAWAISIASLPLPTAWQIMCDV